MYVRLLRHTFENPLMRLQATILMLILFVDWMLMPLITKMEGLYLPVYMIGIFMLLGAADGLIQPLFRKVKVENVYRFSALLDLLQTGCYTLFWVDETLFTYVMLTLFTVQGITFEIARVHTTAMMQHELIIKEFMIFRSFFVSLAIFAGSGFTVIYDLLGGPAQGLVLLAAALTLPGAVLQLVMARQFVKMKKRIMEKKGWTVWKPS